MLQKLEHLNCYFLSLILWAYKYQGISISSAYIPHTLYCHFIDHDLNVHINNSHMEHGYL